MDLLRRVDLDGYVLTVWQDGAYVQGHALVRYALQDPAGQRVTAGVLDWPTHDRRLEVQSRRRQSKAVDSDAVLRSILWSIAAPERRLSDRPVGEDEEWVTEPLQRLYAAYDERLHRFVDGHEPFRDAR
jgi:hypothetical protein